MQEKNKAIVLKYIDYSDTSLILKCYSRDSGIISLIAKGVKSRKKSHIRGLLQPLSMVELISDGNKKSNLRFLKEIRPDYIYKTLHSDPIKIGLSFFLAEILETTLKEEEANHLQFDFIESSLHFLDELNDYKNFHIAFLLELSKYLGFYPNFTAGETYRSFDLENGVFYNYETEFPYHVKGDLVYYLSTFLGTKFVDTNMISMKRDQRSGLLKLVLQFYELHVSGFKEPNSLKILESLYV